MTPDTSSDLWRDIDTQVRQHAPDGTPAIVIRRAVELKYGRALDDAASALIDRIQQTEENRNV